ncbi:hypothetical protein OH77DRAFT_1515138 [Trametes cingulata]|nr:hypothetical protein OH77DRAFT_1515138 [Trametes cingulata]
MINHWACSMRSFAIHSQPPGPSANSTFRWSTIIIFKFVAITVFVPSRSRVAAPFYSPSSLSSPALSFCTVPSLGRLSRLGRLFPPFIVGFRILIDTLTFAYNPWSCTFVVDWRLLAQESEPPDARTLESSCVDLESDSKLLSRTPLEAGRHSLLGPRAAQQAIPGKVPARKPKAKIHGIRSSTVSFIAYTAVLVHLSLNSQESFGDGATAGTFPYEEFYQSIARYFEESMDSDERTSLLAWWTSEIFGHSGDAYTEEEGNTGRPLSVMARMRAQADASTRASAAAFTAMLSASTSSTPLGSLHIGSSTADSGLPTTSLQLKIQQEFCMSLQQREMHDLQDHQMSVVSGTVGARTSARKSFVPTAHTLWIDPVQRI